MSIIQKWVICWHLWCMYEIGMRIPFTKQYRYVRNRLHLGVTNYSFFFCTGILLLLNICCYLVNASISWNTRFTTIVIFGKISTDPVNVFFLTNIGVLHKIPIYRQFTKPLHRGYFEYTYIYISFLSYRYGDALQSSYREGLTKPPYRGASYMCSFWSFSYTYGVASGCPIDRASQSLHMEGALQIPYTGIKCNVQICMKMSPLQTLTPWDRFNSSKMFFVRNWVKCWFVQKQKGHVCLPSSCKWAGRQVSRKLFC